MPNTKCVSGEEQQWGEAAQTGTDGHLTGQMLQTLPQFNTAQDVKGAPRRTEGKVLKAPTVKIKIHPKLCFTQIFALLINDSFFKLWLHKILTCHM